MLRGLFVRSEALPPFALLSTYTQRRHQSVTHHNFLNRGPLSDSRGLEHGGNEAAGQQSANDHEQFLGYSDSYLARTPMYFSRHEGYTVERQKDLFDDVLQMCYEVYGDAADILQQLHSDPLHPNFHPMLAQAVAHRERFASKIDEMYASAHPTYKTLMDAYAVRRYYFLIDWEKAVENKRKEILEKLSPEFIAESIKGKNLAESYKRNLELLGDFINSTKALPADINESQLQPVELEILRKKATFQRKLRQYGRTASDGDINIR